MDTIIDLPYFSSDLPCPLPTEDEIEQASDISLAYGGRRVVAVGQNLVVKYGVGVNLIEGENMLLVQRNTSIRVPKVWALYHKAGKNYIIMERIHGQTLLSLWPTLEPSEKEAVSSALHSYFEELRRLPPPNYYGSVGKRPLLDDIFWTSTPVPTINGPFASQDAVIEAFAQKYTHDGRPSYRADYFRQCLPRVLSNGGPIFTHGDFQRKNIMVQTNVCADGPSPNRYSITLIDWERSGWYPEFWEYGLGSASLRWDDDWCLWIGKILEPYCSEASWVCTLRFELWS